jgi:hypothetical protein
MHERMIASVMHDACIHTYACKYECGTLLVAEWCLIPIQRSICCIMKCCIMYVVIM